MSKAEQSFSVVTGGSRGIGYSIAKQIAQDGYDLLLVAQDKAQLEKAANDLAKKYDVSVDYLAGDLASVTERQKIIDKINARPGSITHLVNNAGFGDFAYLEEAEGKKLQAMVDVNISAVVDLTRQLLPKLTKNSGILNVASVAGFMPGPRMATYYATKAFVLSFSEALAEELRPKHIGVSVLCPGPTKTHFTDVAGSGSAKIFSHAVSADRVAAYGYQALKRGKVVAIDSPKYRLAIIALRILPRRLVVRLVHRAHNS